MCKSSISYCLRADAQLYDIFVTAKKIIVETNSEISV